MPSHRSPAAQRRANAPVPTMSPLNPSTLSRFSPPLESSVFAGVMVVTEAALTLRTTAGGEVLSGHALDSDLLLSKGFHVAVDGVPIIFDT